MPGNVRGGNGLARSPGGRASRTIILGIPGSRMGVERGLADIGHTKYPRGRPSSSGSYCQPGTVVFGVHFLKIRQHTLRAVTGPDNRRLMVGTADELGYLPV